MGTFFKKNRVKAGEFLLFLSGTLVLVSLFITSSHLYDGILIAKEHWFRYTSALFGSATFLFFLFGKKKRLISFSTSDVLVLMGIGWSILTYNEVINPAPERMGLLIQLAAFWFFLRFSFTEYPRLRKAFLFILIVTAIIEVMIGMSQLYGINRSFNPNYRITGSFFNPGPFAGYIAVAFPLLLDFLLKQYNERKGTNRKYPFWFWGGVVSFALMLAVLPSTLSRSAWLAALIPSFLIIAYRLDWWKKWQEWRSESGSRSIWILLVLPLILILFIASLYALKKDSADGRLFMWKITASALCKSPFTGFGTGGFPEVYGEAQAEYFKSGTASYQEELVAGSPAFAFNEYLQIAVETGIPGLVLFLLLLSDSLFKGVRQKEWGITGALLAFMLFAFSSYPLQLIPFQILLVFLLVALQPLNEETETAYLCGKRVFSFFLLGICLFASLYVCYRQRDVYANYRKWYQIKSYYLLLDYKKAVEAYGQLLPVFGYQPAFLFEYAQSLSKSGHYAEADKYLMRLSCLSCDPMVYNTMGKNHQENGAYEKAEASFIRAAQLLPGRLYPYYLLAKLYAEPRFYNEQKMKKMACTVLGKEPKVQTTAVREMRAEMRILLKQHDYKDSNK